MLFSRPTRAFGALLLLASTGTAVQAQADSGVSLVMTDMSEHIIAGNSVGFQFTLSNGSDEAVAGIVAVLTDPTGRTLSQRSIHAGDIAPGASLTKTPSRPIPDNVIPGTYTMSLEARAADGSTLASAPRQFDVLSTTRSFRAPGLDFGFSDAPASIAAGDTFGARVQLTNDTEELIDRVYAVVIDPSGRVLTSRNIHSGNVASGNQLDKWYEQFITPQAMLGTYEVQIQCRSAAGRIMSTSPFSLNVTAQAAGLRAAERLTAFPNPAVDQATLRFALAEDARASLAVYDALGRQVSAQLDGTVRAGRTESSVDVSSLAPGLYVARLMVEGGASQTTRFTVAR